MENAESKILQGLNPAQYAAVVDYESPSLIIAGAGSGKTRVLTSRIAYMIEQGVAPFRILALTFTNKAASEMRERIAMMIPGNRARYIRMGTFHSVFARILRENAERIGFPQSFTIYEPDDVKNLLKTIIRELRLNEDSYKPNAIAARISLAKNSLITPGAYKANSACATEDRQARIPEFGNIYEIYCQRCKRQGAMDFDDLLLQTNILLRDCKDVLAKYQELFQYVLVDEYQDTNYAQYVILRLLAMQHSRICVVGDDAQSIYSFRGAKIENILTFRKDYPTAKIFKLEQNYRSTRTIVEAANSLIAKNEHRMEKHCFSMGDKGDPIRIMSAYTDREEADMVIKDLNDKVRSEGALWSDVVVLYRMNNQSKAIEDSLRHAGIPYRIYKGSSFYDHKEIRDMIGYIRLIVNPHDDEAFKRIINTPARGIGNTTVERIGQLAESRGVSMWEAVDALVSEPVTDPVQKTIARKVNEFVQMIREISLTRATKGLYDFGMEVAARSGLLTFYRADNSPESISALDNIEELLNTMQLFSEQVDAEIRNNERSAEEVATVDEWLQNIMLLTDMDQDDPNDRNKVTLMTVHSAKGLEYKYVYIVGVEENLFPSKRALESVEGIEEERRLFYVALTRAEKAVTISCAESRFTWGTMEFSKPSRFLREIDEKYVDSEIDLAPKRGGWVESDDEEGGSALDRLRRRFDYRFQQKLEQNSGRGSAQGSARGSMQGSGRGSMQAQGRTSSPSHAAPSVSFGSPSRTSTEGLRRVGSYRKSDPVTEAAPASGANYSIGERVSHPIFGAGTIRRIDRVGADYKLMITFDREGDKVLLAKFAKLIRIS